ncbi:uncharacterized protein LOC114333138 [Diabrotica virgifera virgifera]|uniref:Uncharacterized protein LOC114333138 n=1 Tax=Diabrotica virgifera virgifera TaxID=50390 RepID=A0A6P7FR73_DIAVI|nr:uncharacterized protein LOC114333138 [Diabrotica virgifera virgifera]
MVVKFIVLFGVLFNVGAVMVNGFLYDPFQSRLLNVLIPDGLLGRNWNYIASEIYNPFFGRGHYGYYEGPYPGGYHGYEQDSTYPYSFIVPIFGRRYSNYYGGPNYGGYETQESYVSYSR